MYCIFIASTLNNEENELMTSYASMCFVKWKIVYLVFFTAFIPLNYIIYSECFISVFWKWNKCYKNITLFKALWKWNKCYKNITCNSITNLRLSGQLFPPLCLFVWMYVFVCGCVCVHVHLSVCVCVCVCMCLSVIKWERELKVSGKLSHSY